jgi:hypothetical protein
VCQGAPVRTVCPPHPWHPSRPTSFSLHPSIMRERITFVHPPHARVDADLPTVDDAGLRGPRVESVREDKLTVPLDQLPSSVSTVLRAFSRLRLQWASPHSYDTLDPYAARVSPGLHVSCAPFPRTGVDLTTLCSLLQAFGTLDCASSEAFTRLGAQRSSNQPALYNYYQALESLDIFAKSVSQEACKASGSVCHERFQALQDAVSLDISVASVDGKPQSLEIKALWPLADRQVSATLSPGRRTEVGLLTKAAGNPSQGQHELAVEGALVVLGQQSKLSPTAFAFPARHRVADASFSTRFLSPTGLHPTLQLSMSTSQAPLPDSQCSPFVYLTLPRFIFADRHQLADALFLASKNLTATRYTSVPVDLEAPEYTTETWGSSVLLEMAPPSSGSSQPTSWTAEVPLHLRYLKPSSSGYAQVELPYPVVFWACSTDEDGWNRNPFERSDLGYDGLFDADTVFWHLNPKPVGNGRLTNSLTVPVLQTKGAPWISSGTSAVVALGFAWVLWQLLGIYRKTGYGASEARAQEAKDKKKQ